MNKKDLEKIQSILGYKFNEPMLLKQAFTRRSYSQEHGGQNNEVLEFFGDKVLDFVVTKRIATYFGEQCQYGTYITFGGEGEGEFTKIKEKLVERSMLAHRIDILGIADFLIMGKGDIAKNVQNEESVKEDLFEAIIGAVSVDCNWNIEVIQNVVERMLDVRKYFKNSSTIHNNYVDLVQQWWQKQFGQIPGYGFHSSVEQTVTESMARFMGQCHENGKGMIACQLDYAGLVFIGRGKSNSEARENTAQIFYSYLEKHNLLFSLKYDIGDPYEEKAISQLHELAQKGYIEFPEYHFEEDHDEDGNPLWTCECSVDGYENSYINTCSSKKEAKRASAYEMLLEVLSKYTEE